MWLKQAKLQLKEGEVKENKGAKGKFFKDPSINYNFKLHFKEIF